MLLFGLEAFVLNTEHIRVFATTHTSAGSFRNGAGGELTTCRRLFKAPVQL